MSSQRMDYIVCRTCNGTGLSDSCAGIECWDCGGHGEVIVYDHDEGPESEQEALNGGEHGSCSGTA